MFSFVLEFPLVALVFRLMSNLESVRAWSWFCFYLFINFLDLNLLKMNWSFFFFFKFSNRVVFFHCHFLYLIAASSNLFWLTFLRKLRICFSFSNFWSYSDCWDMLQNWRQFQYNLLSINIWQIYKMEKKEDKKLIKEE